MHLAHPSESLDSVLPNSPSVEKELCSLKLEIISLKEQVSQLTLLMKTCCPQIAAVDKVLDTNKELLRSAALEVQDNTTRAPRIIIWGRFDPQSSTPFLLSGNLLRFVLGRYPVTIKTADWFRKKGCKTPSGLLVTTGGPR